MQDSTSAKRGSRAVGGRGCDGAAQAADRAGLLDLLRRQSLSAVDRFTAIEPALRRHLSERTCERMRRQIDNLKFNGAADALEAETTAPQAQ